jgi:anti-anti-sigma factor
MCKPANSKTKVVCTFSKRMDTTECIKEESNILEKIDKAGTITFDMQDVEYIASSFLRICRKAADKVEEGNFTIINTAAPVSKIFRIAGLSKILNIS